MSILDDVADLYPDTILVTPRPTVDGWGVESGTSTASYAARISARLVRVRTADGEVTVQQQYATVRGLVSGLDTNAKVTLPARFDPREPKITSIATPTDEDGPLFVRIFF